MKTAYRLLLPTLVALASSFLPSNAQDAAKPDPAKPETHGGGQPGRGNYEEFRQRMNERLKASLKMTDEEWTAISPLIEKVQTKQREAMASRFGGRSRGGDAAAPGTPVRGTDSQRPSVEDSQRQGSAESQALRTALEAESTTPEDLKAKLAAVRESRKKSAAELETVREELRKVLTVRQEAALVSAGILD